ncbi:uncharacterized protein LOC131680080 [Topomyia yanbarensis]|uniref:uncharacterized protein LOC131680080 n=1 Tax=Topomyia yanbarensis TaxID=2498891 RepID=UPI00273B7429|nr:uncharacterized protein LOC131680080 [Topomyia yanbarensis]
MADEFEKHVKILDSLETKAQHWDSVLVELLFSRMDTNAQKLWENQRDKTKRPSYEDLVLFIHEHSRTLQSLKLSQNVISFAETKPPKPHALANHYASEQVQRFAACKQTHYLFQCEFFRSQTPHQRFELVKRNNLCINCLRAAHYGKNCTSGSCKYCQRKHHTLLHLPPSPTLLATEAPPHMQPAPVTMLHQQSRFENQMSHPPPVTQISDSVGTSVGRSVSLSSPSVLAPFPAPSGTVAPPFTSCQTVTPVPMSDHTVLLFTALVKVRDNLGQTHLARVLLDSGSQSNFISESLCQRLALNRRKVNVPVSGIGQAIVNVRYTVSVQFSSHFRSHEYCLECLVLPKLTVSLPTRTVDISAWKLPEHLPLADPQFNVSHGIDLIVGAELFSMILQAEQIAFDDQLPVLQKTSLGYIIAGKIPTNTSSLVTCLVSTFDDLDAQVRKFWEVENFDHGKAYTTDEQQCETHFVTTHNRNDEGRYVVRLPTRQEMLPLIGETWPTAARRFTAMEKRFRGDTGLRFSYVQFMEEYKQLDHMEEVQTRAALPQFFLPHHAISRPDSSTIKVRVVFDGSCKSSNHLSLNDLLLTGPTVQPTLLSIVLNFRLHRYVMIADIEKMYRQILVHPDDRPLQQILWRQQAWEQIKPYLLNTVTYGTSSAPFLATRTLNQLAEDDGKDFPLAALVVKQGFYVDDLLTGSDNLETLVETGHQLVSLLNRGGFSLRKWSANHPTILEHIPEKDRETLTVVELDQSPSIKTLGLLWFPTEGLFGFKVPQLPPLERVTRRIALSEMSQLFDPLGLVGPVVASAKIFVQQLWQENLRWDDELPEKLQLWWLSFRASIDVLRSLRVPRWVMVPSTTNYELHCFTDASERGYGCCIYVVSTDGKSKSSHLLIAKSRVAPAGGLSIPLWNFVLPFWEVN